ncbi:mediator of RNA polymerase II transcription subunit 6-like isoform X2 [Lineus longissimus]
MDYFSDRSNQFYDPTCNNEIVKMQRLNPEQLNNMPGLEYILLHVQPPILYVIRKQHRHSPTQVTPLADYYIIAGVIYQAPDLCSVINSRMLNTVCSLQSAFDEALSYSRYHPSKGYYFEFKDQEPKEKSKEKKKEEPSSVFQRQRVDVLLGELAKKFPLKPQNQPPVEKQEEPHIVVKQEPKEIKTEKTDDKSSQSTHSGIKPPAEKKPKIIR